MTDKEKAAETKAEKSDKAVTVQRGALSPLRAFEERFEQLERFMDRMTSTMSAGRWLRPFERGESVHWGELAEARAPAVDLIDRENEIVIRAELPGVRKEEIAISLTDDSITLETQSRKDETEEKGAFRRREIRSSRFVRTLWLPSGVDTQAAKATFKDGVLEVTLPKSAGAKRTQVAIE